MRVGIQSLFRPLHENVGPAFSPEPTDCPWVFEDEELASPQNEEGITKLKYKESPQLEGTIILFCPIIKQ